MAVVGTGLIGTSLALAARRAGVTVYLKDTSDLAVRTAAALGAGLPHPPEHEVDLAVLAVPPSQVGRVCAEEQARGLARCYTDVASVKHEPERRVLALAPEPERFVGGHPLAGRERSGPLAARADLFRGRPWVLTPHTRTSDAAYDAGLDLIALCEGAPVAMNSAAHDDAVALISHVPHLVASLMAARLATAPQEASLLAGQGFRDVTRIAAGDTGLWSDILGGNAGAIAAVLRPLRDDLTRLLAAMDGLAGRGPAGPAGTPADPRPLRELLDRGVTGLSRLPGAPARRQLFGSVLRVPLDGGPGELARLLAVTSPLGAGADDAAVSAGPDGRLVVTLTVPPGLAGTLREALAAEGWFAGQPAAASAAT